MSALLRALAVLLVLLCWAEARAAAGLPLVRLYVFSSPDCPHCEPLKEEKLQALATRVGVRIEAQTFDLNDIESYRKLTGLEQARGDTDNQVPVVVIGNTILGGPTEVEERLEATIVRYGREGGTDWPDAPVAAPASPRGEAQEKPVAQPPSSPASPGVPPVQQTAPTQALPGEPARPALARTPHPDVPTSLTPAPQETLTSPAPGAVPSAPPVRLSDPAPVYLAFFYQSGCRECDRVFYLLKYVQSRYPYLVVREFDLAQPGNKEINEAVVARCGIPEGKRLTAATIAIGNEALQMGEITEANLEGLLARYTPGGSPCTWELSEAERQSAAGRIAGRFQALGALVVATAGLVDGINPCAFTTLIFFISYLVALGRRGRELLAVGGAFAFGVFLAYFLMGLGALQFLGFLTAWHGVGRAISAGIGVLALLLAAFSFRDFVRARRGQMGAITLQLPTGIKRRLHAVIRTRMSVRASMGAACVVGVLVSVLEAACTGQVYLPTIIYVLNDVQLRRTGVLYLLLYNLMFIVPLVVIFLLAWRGSASALLQRLAREHVAPVKLATAILFAGLGAFVLRSLIPG